MLRKHGKRFWKFFWHSDSFWSWLVNIIVAFFVIRYLFYPFIGMVLGTGFPIVAVVSESMEHGLHNGMICGNQFRDFKESFDNYWDSCGSWYENRGITKKQFQNFKFRNGFNKGDVIILWRSNPQNTEVGDILIFQNDKPQPIIHRVVKITKEDDQRYYTTKGDHNSNTINGSFGETKINESRVYGKGILRIPYLGWLKILFVEGAQIFGINIER